MRKPENDVNKICNIIEKLVVTHTNAMPKTAESILLNITSVFEINLLRLTIARLDDFQTTVSVDASRFWHDETAYLAERSTMTFSVTVDRDEDGVWIVECPAIPGCVSQGATKDEAPPTLPRLSGCAWKCGPSRDSL